MSNQSSMRSRSFCVGENLNSSIQGERQNGFRYALWTLTILNVINFAARYVPAAVKDLIKIDLNLSDTETAFPSSGIVFVHVSFALIFGHLVDNEILDRRKMLVFGVVLRSFATFLAGFSQDLKDLILLRSLIGVGEAAFSTIAPPMLSDLFPARDRNVVFGIYYLAVPIGTALGYGIGGIIGASFGWRYAFFICGISGLVLGTLIVGLNDPVRGINDARESNKRENESSIETEPQPVSPSPSMTSINDREKQSFEDIISNKHFICLLAGASAINFTLGGLADWYLTYLTRCRGLSIADAGLYLGAATVIGGVLGNVLGAKVSKFFEPKIKSAYYLIPAIFTIPAVILLGIGVNIDMSGGETFVLLLIAEVFLWTFLAPQSAIAHNIIPPRLRARACGLLIFFQHILGDAISPPIIGLISDQTGSLRNGLQLTWITLLLSGLIWFLGYYFLDALPIATSQSMRTGSSYLEILCGCNKDLIQKSATDKIKQKDCTSHFGLSDRCLDGDNVTLFSDQGYCKLDQNKLNEDNSSEMNPVHSNSSVLLR